MTIEEELIKLFDKMADDPRFYEPIKQSIDERCFEWEIHIEDQTTLDEMQTEIKKRDAIIEEKDRLLDKLKDVMLKDNVIKYLESKIVLKDKALVAAREIIDESYRRAAHYKVENEALEAELSIRKQDSEVLMKVVEEVRQCEGAGEHGTAMQFYRITTLVEDYLDTPEPPIEENCITVKVAYLEMP